MIGQPQNLTVLFHNLIRVLRGFFLQSAPQKRLEKLLRFKRLPVHRGEIHAQPESSASFSTALSMGNIYPTLVITNYVPLSSWPSNNCVRRRRRRT